MTDLTFIKLTDTQGNDCLICVNLIASMHRKAGYTSIYLNTYNSNTVYRVDVKDEVHSIALKLSGAK